MIPFLILYTIITILFIFSFISIRNTCKQIGSDFNPFEAKNIFIYMFFIVGLITKIFTIIGILFYMIVKSFL